MDTNVLVAALYGRRNDSLRILEACLTDRATPLCGSALWSEYRDVLARGEVFANATSNAADRDNVFRGFAAAIEWVEPAFLWRPNLADEGDNHLVEIAVAGGADYIVTRNIADLAGGELQFPQIAIVEPGELAEELD